VGARSGGRHAEEGWSLHAMTVGQAGRRPLFPACLSSLSCLRPPWQISSPRSFAARIERQFAAFALPKVLDDVRKLRYSGQGARREAGCSGRSVKSASSSAAARLRWTLRPMARSRAPNQPDRKATGDYDLIEDGLEVVDQHGVGFRHVLLLSPGLEWLPHCPNSRP
jgi:hypothetical protein